MRIIKCVLKPEKEKPLEGRHPWVFSGAIDQIDDSFQAGDLVKVFSSQDRFLGIGYLNPRSQIAVRMLTFEDVRIDEGFFEKRLQSAAALRSAFVPSDTNAYRAVNAEGDFLPGLIVDRYADYLAVQFLTSAMDQWKEMIAKLLMKIFPVRGVFEKDDTEARDWEGLTQRVGRLAGDDPPDYVEIVENGHPFVVDIHGGQKTGFFLDQRDNRLRAAKLARGRRVLNCFAYTGGFSVYAAKGGAVETVSVDTSEPALNTARTNFEKNGLPAAEAMFLQEDVFDYLRSTRQEFDLIILDPPAFCKNKHQVQQAARGYKDINLWALKRLSRGGILMTFSCSSHIDPDLFQKIIFGAAKDVRRDVRVLERTGHPFDHPVSIYHPEGEYLKGLTCLAD